MLEEQDLNKEAADNWYDPNRDAPDKNSQMPKSSTFDHLQQGDDSLSIHRDEKTQPVMVENQTRQTERNAAKMPAARKFAEEELAWFNQDETNELNARWKSIQSQFVDEPCTAVEQAETLATETAERLKQIIDDQTQALTQQWLNHDDISTEELRVTMINYRTLLNHLLKL